MRSIVRRAASTVVAASMILTALPALDFSSMTAAAATTKAAASKSVPSGFVYADGTEFKCDGSPYYFGGTNCYYLIYKEKDAVDNVFTDMNNMGLNVVRTWGHLDVGTKAENFSESNPTFNNNRDGVGHKDGVYFQYFDKDKKCPVVNEGANGLERLDYVVQQAEKHNVKLIVTFTNYWEAFGGMDQYCLWMKEAGLGEHKRNEFYTNETMKKWYKNYINTLLNHTNKYTGEKLKDSEAIFSWELCNEPRVQRDYGDSSMPETIDMGCEQDILYNWAKEMSEYTKSIDPNHMVSIGDEGFFNFEKTEASLAEHGIDSWFAFTGDAGVDYDKLMTIDTVDFGTPHMYADQWNMCYRPTSQSALGSGKDQGLDDDKDWIKLHAKSAQAANKPVILEEFGLSHDKCNLLTKDDKSARDPYYKAWLDLMDGSSFNGEYSFAGYTYWMIASKGSDPQGFPNGYYPDWDGYSIYGTAEDDAKENPKSNARDLIIKSTAKMNAKNETNFFGAKNYDYDLKNGGNLTTSLSIMKNGSLSSVSFNGKALTKGTDYTVTKTGSTEKNDVYNLVINSSVLKGIALKGYALEAKCSVGAVAKTTVTVDNSSIVSAKLNKLSADTVDKNKRYTTELSAEFTLNGNTLTGVTVDGKALKKGTDYSVSGSKVTFTRSAVRSFPDKKATLGFEFTPGKAVYKDVEVVDTTGNDEFDEFESYNSSDDVWSAYSRNTGGNEVGLNVVNKDNNKVLKYDYKIDSPDYCGVTKKLGKDMSAYKGVSLYVEGDGSGNQLTVQIQSGNDYREAYIKLDFTGGKTVFLPFDSFKAPSWQGDGTGVDAKNISNYSLYMGGGGKTTSGTIYVDQILAANEELPYPYVIDDPIPPTPTTKSLSECDVDVYPEATFTGTTIKQKATIKDGSKTLVEGTDYTIAYKNNAKVGTATMTITGKGDYTGSVTKNFKILPKSIKYCTVKIGGKTVKNGGNAGAYKYKGTAIKPTVRVYIGNGEVYKGNYTVTYKNNVNRGTATIVVTAKSAGSLNGKTTYTFSIK